MCKSVASLGAAVLFLATVAGCSDSTRPSGSQALIMSDDRSLIFVADPDNGEVARVHLDTREVDAIAVGREPTRMARIDGDRFVVSLRGERALAVIAEDGDGTLAVEQKIPVGAEPYGVIAQPDGSRVYVASSLSGRVDELDADTFEVLRSWSVADEPRWLAIHPSGESLYVASAFRGTFTRIDLEDGRTEAVTLPQGPFDAARALRLTGDPAVSSNGELLVIPMLSVDNTTPVAEDEPVPGIPASPSPSGYGAVGPGGLGRFEAAIAVLNLEGSGRPTALNQDFVIRARGVVPEAAGYLTSLGISPSSAVIFGTIEGASAVVALPFDTAGRDFRDLGFVASINATVLVPAGPRGIAFGADDQAYVYSGLDRSVVSFDARAVELSIGEQRVAGPTKAAARFPLGTSQLQAVAARGRQFFYASASDQMAVPGAGVSCATCHFEGRNDGLTWSFTRGARQTPSLAGPVSMTAPVRWEGDRVSVAEDARRTMNGLMGGIGGQDIARDIEIYIDATRDVDVPLKASTDPEVLLGKSIFERADVGCATCHNGPRHTDLRLYAMFDLPAVKTRSLTGVAASPPYLHDGSAPTLRDVLERSRGGAMGNTSSLDDTEMSALVKYLESL